MFNINFKGETMLIKIKAFCKNLFKSMYDNRAYIMIILIALFIFIMAYEYYGHYFNVFRNPQKIKNIILSYGDYSIFAFLALQIIQVIAFFIPGEVIQIAGGYIYTTFEGGFLSLLGITIGSAIVYSISRFYGKPFIEKIISKKHIKFFDKILKLGNINFAIFLLYLIPGIPKDVLAYICGISNINFKNFMIYSTAGRIPGIFLSAFFGFKMYSGNKNILIIIAITAAILFIVGIFKGEKIIKSLIRKE